MERRAGEQQTEGDGEAGERGAEGGGLVLEPMALVDRDRVEQERLREEGLLRPQGVVRSEVDVVLRLHYRRRVEKAVALAGTAIDLDEGELGGEALQLVCPVLEHGQRRHNEVWPGQAGRLEPREESECLYGLAQPHLVAEDAARADSILREQPVDALALVRAQLCFDVRLVRADGERLGLRQDGRAACRQPGHRVGGDEGCQCRLILLEKPGGSRTDLFVHGTHGADSLLKARVL